MQLFSKRNYFPRNPSYPAQRSRWAWRHCPDFSETRAQLDARKIGVLACLFALVQ
jgi:hypothetical protein